MSIKRLLPWLVCLALSLGVAGLRLGPVLWQPDAYLLGGWGHPDNIGNHWLLVWVAEQLSAGQSIIHNTDYYAPIGDYPWLAGNGSEGFLYWPLHRLFGWPVAILPLVLGYFIGLGLGGYFLACVLGVGRWSAVFCSSAIVSSGFWVREINAGRFSQLDGVWLIWSLALFIGLFTESRSRFWVLLCGVCIGLTGVFYWYYAYFFVLMASIVVLTAWLLKVSIPWRQIGLAAVVSWIVITPLAWIYWQHWSLVPGTDETTFPSADAFADALNLTGSWLSPFGRTAGAVQALPTWILMGFGGMVGWRSRKSDHLRMWGVSSICLMSLFFLLLSAGPKLPLFELVYGWNDALRRFWWPSRHLLVWTVGCALLAGFGLDYVLDRWDNRWRVVIAILASISVPASLWLQGDRPFHANHTPLEYPLAEYQPIKELTGDVILMPPLNPKVANTQLPLLFQLTHQKRLLTGHGMWVDRVRPREWDQQIANHRLLNLLSKFELGSEAQTISVTGEDMESFRALGIDLVILDAKVFPRPMMGLVPHLANIYTQLFGEPIHRGDQLRVWSTSTWTAVPTLTIPAWSPSSSLTFGDGRHRMPYPVVGRGIK